MEPSLDFMIDLFQEADEESSCVEEENEKGEEEYTAKKAPLVKPWYQRSRKSLVRMIGSTLIWHWSDRRRRKFRNRSVVRMIASRLPLKPSKRAYFEIFVESNRAVMSKARNFLEENLNKVKLQLPEVNYENMGLADMGLFTWNEFDDDSVDSKSGVITRSTFDNSNLSLSSISNVSSEDVNKAPPRCLKRGKKVCEKEGSDKKITALEDELANLRAQIAMIVSLQEKASEPVIPVAPPPPPPPPPMIPATPPPTPLPRVENRIPKQPNNAKKINNKAVDNGVPSMSDVLAGLSNVKLRSANIARSPGGTPLKAKSRMQSQSSQDPADVIANALRKKFAKARKSIGSPITDKENQLSPHGGFSPSPIKKVDSPCFLPITSSPEKGRKSRRRSSTLTGSRIILSPVKEN